MADYDEGAVSTLELCAGASSNVLKLAIGLSTPSVAF